MAATCPERGERVSAKACPESGYLAAGPPGPPVPSVTFAQPRVEEVMAKASGHPDVALSPVSRRVLCAWQPSSPPPPTPLPGSEPRSLGGPSYHVLGQGVGSGAS